MKRCKQRTKIWISVIILLLSVGMRENILALEIQEKILRYVNYYSIDFGHIVPTQELNNTEYTITYHTLEGLMRIYQYKLQYGMAESYEISTDGLVYTFHIRKEAYYSDGTPVTAYDFQRAFLYNIKENADSDYIQVIKNAKDISRGIRKTEELGVEIIDENTLQIELEYPDSRFLRYLALPEFSPMREDTEENLTSKDCNGPFYLEEIKGDTFCRLKKNPYYWNRKRIALDAIESVYYPDSGEARKALDNGEVDVVPVATEKIKKNKKEVQRRAMTGTSDDIYMDLHSESILSNRNLRLALNYCLNRKEYVEKLGNGLIEPKVRCVPPIGEGTCQRYIKRNPDSKFPLKGDREKAQKYLKKAMEELGISEAKELRIPLAVHDDQWSKKEASAVSEQWEKNLGIIIDMYYVDDKKIELELEQRNNKGLVLTGEQEEFSDPAEYLKKWDYQYLPQNKSNIEQFHQYMMQAKNQADEQIRFNILYEAEQILMEEAPYIPLQLRYEMLLLNPNLTGFQTNADLSGSQYEFLYADFK